MSYIMQSLLVRVCFSIRLQNLCKNANIIFEFLHRFWSSMIAKMMSPGVPTFPLSALRDLAFSPFSLSKEGESLPAPPPPSEVLTGDTSDLSSIWRIKLHKKWARQEKHRILFDFWHRFWRCQIRPCVAHDIWHVMRQRGTEIRNLRRI